jgi:tRNA(Ile)-lysidine synthase
MVDGKKLKSSTNHEPLTLNHASLSPSSHILVAVSGGADSMALLHALHDLAPRFGWRLTVAHLHHGLRGVPADGDARFVADTAAQLGLSCVVGRARVPAAARRQGISIEMAAREARYAFLVRTARKVNAEVMVTAHTADDQAETVLLKLIRGAGRSGLAGIPQEGAVKGCRLVRPLLAVTRASILAYLKDRKLTWREDESNADRSFLRNRVRHELLPLLEKEFNPRLRETLFRTSRILAAEEEWLEELAGGMLAGCAGGSLTPTHSPQRRGRQVGDLSCVRLNRYPLAARRRVIRRWLIQGTAPESCLDFETVDRILALCERPKGSKTLLLGEGWGARRVYDRLTLDRIASRGPSAFSVRVRVPGETVLPEQGWRIVAQLAPGLVRDRPPGPGHLPARASFSAAVWNRQPLVVRSWRAGDKMDPFGMKGSKKIQDILVDEKIPQGERLALPLFESGHEIVWLPGYRVARSWAVTDPDAVNLQLSVERLA